MTKFKMNGKNLMMGLSLFAFMILGSVSASAQWVSSSDAFVLLKQELTTLENDFNQATTDEQRIEIAFETRYYQTVMSNIAGGMEVPAAVEDARPSNKPVLHSSGLIAFAAAGENFKNEAQALVDAGTDLLSN